MTTEKGCFREGTAFFYVNGILPLGSLHFLKRCKKIIDPKAILLKFN